MNLRILNILLICFSLLAYLEWGGGNQSYIYEIEAELFTKIFTNPSTLIHPFILLPVIGQILLLVSIFHTPYKTIITYMGMTCIGLLFSFILFIGIIKGNLKILISVMPFFITAIYTIQFLRNKSAKSQ